MKMEENVDGAIVLFQKYVMGKEMTFVTHVCEEGKAKRSETMYAEPTSRSQITTLTNGANIEEETATVFRKLNNDFQNFETDGSGWSIDKIIKMEVTTVEYVPLTGSSYVPFTNKIMPKKAVLNIVNDDQTFLFGVY